MDDREAMLASVFDRWADDAPKLQFADWLDDEGKPELAEKIRRITYKRAWKSPYDFAEVAGWIPPVYEVQSTYVDQVSHLGGVLRIRFHPPPRMDEGAVFDFFGVSPSEFNDLLRSSCKGIYFHRYVRDLPRIEVSPARRARWPVPSR